MTKRLNKKFGTDRRYGENIWGRAKSPVNKRSYKPGQHGPLSKQGGGGDKVSPYGLQLAAKQKLRTYYGLIREKQFRRIYKEAARLRGDTGQNFVGLLERRLDAVVYNMKFVSTIFAARQFVSHGHVCVNGKRVDIPSYLVREGDEISVRTASKKLTSVIEAMSSAERDVPDYIQMNDKAVKGSLLRQPKFEEIPYPCKHSPQLIVEWYSRRV